MVLTVTLAEISGQDGAKQPDNGRYRRDVTINITGDASSVSAALPNVRALGFTEVTRIHPLEPLTAATPDENLYHHLKFVKTPSTGAWTVYVGDAHAGGPVAAAAYSATIRLIGY